MDYNKLKTFVIVAEFGSITAAAVLLRRSQSAISQQIQLLEDELEMRLLERKSARIFLSKDGEQLYRAAKEKLGQIDDEVSTLRSTAHLVEGHIMTGFLNDYGNEFRIGKYLSEFSNEYPKITFEIIEGTSRDLEPQLLENKLDLAFTVYFTQPEMFIRRPLGKTWHSIYASKAYLERAGTPKNFKEVLNASLIDLSHDFACFITSYRKNAPTLVPSLMHRRPNIVAPNFEIAKEIITSGYGIGYLPEYLMKNYPVTKKCTRLLTSAKRIFAGVDIAYRTNKTLRLCEKLFIEHCLKKAKY